MTAKKTTRKAAGEKASSEVLDKAKAGGKLTLEELEKILPADASAEEIDRVMLTLSDTDIDFTDEHPADQAKPAVPAPAPLTKAEAKAEAKAETEPKAPGHAPASALKSAESLEKIVQIVDRAFEVSRASLLRDLGQYWPELRKNVAKAGSVTRQLGRSSP